MKNGTGSYILPYNNLLYYKGLPNTYLGCGFPDATHFGFCTKLPYGLEYVAGFNMATMTGGSAAPGGSAQEQAAFTFECRKNPQQDTRCTGTTSYATMDALVDAMIAAGTSSNSILYQTIQGETCWDGAYVDTANHRSHMSYPDGPLVRSNGPSSAFVASCPTDHPYMIPTWSWQRWFLMDPAFLQKKWHLSSDEMMTMAVAAGYTAHGDYWNTWSPTGETTWTDYCENQHMSCELGNLGNNLQLKHPVSQQKIKYIAVSQTKYGEGKPITAAGTYTGEITAQDAGQLYLYGYFGFSGQVTAWSLTDVTKATNHNVTITGTR
jgi:hypothetical protein